MPELITLKKRQETRAGVPQHLIDRKVLAAERISIPYLPIPFDKAVGMATPLRGANAFARSLNPRLAVDLEEANMIVDIDDYASVILLTGVFYAGLMGFAVLSFSLNSLFDQIAGVNAGSLKLLLFASAFLVGLVMMVQVAIYPKIKANMKARLIDKDLLYALRHMTVQIRAGSTLFDSMKSIAIGGYGEVSDEFGTTVKQISSGTPIAVGINNMALRNKSEPFRKVLWQLENAVRTGTDLGGVLLNLTTNYFNEQRVAIQKFGKDMNGLTMMFMMLTVIFPVMSIIMLVLAALLPVPSPPPIVLWVLLIVISIVQLFFIGFVKEKRPPVYF